MLTQKILFVNDFKIKSAPSGKENSLMAKTKSSVRGKPQKKIVPVKSYKKADGTRVRGYRRSTPN